jgi:hypothetical protein
VNENESPFDLLRLTVTPDAAAAIEHLVREGSDRDLCRLNVLDFAKRNGFDEERAIGAFLHAAKLGIFEMSWNVLCPGCGGVLDANATLKTVHQSEYSCALCAAGYEPTLDEMVEVTFTVSPRVRRIAGHDPNSLPMWEYARQIFWSSGVDLPEDALFKKLIDEITLDSIELPAGEKATMSLQLPPEFVIIFEPVTHAAHFIDVKGESTRARQTFSLVYNNTRAPTGKIELRPGPLSIALANGSDRRVLPTAWIAGDKLHHLLGKRKPFLTAKLLLTNQTFRDLYRADTPDRTAEGRAHLLFTDLWPDRFMSRHDLNAYDGEGTFSLAA